MMSPTNSPLKTLVRSLERADLSVRWIKASPKDMMATIDYLACFRQFTLGGA